MESCCAKSAKSAPKHPVNRLRAAQPTKDEPLDIRRVPWGRRALSAVPHTPRDRLSLRSQPTNGATQCAAPPVGNVQGAVFLTHKSTQFQPRQARLAGPWRAITLNPLNPEGRKEGSLSLPQIEPQLRGDAHVRVRVYSVQRDVSVGRYENSSAVSGAQRT